MFIKIFKNIRLVMFVFFLLIIQGLIGCTLIKSIDTGQNIKKNMHKDIIGDEIIRCILERDKVSLSNLFCEKVRNTDYLNKEIDFFFDYIDEYGIQIDEGGKWESGSGHSSQSGGRRVVDLRGGDYERVIEIGNKEYNISFIEYTILMGHKEYEGVTHIIISDVRNLLDATLEQRNVAINDNTPSKYLGIGIFNTNYNSYLYENVAPKELYENEEYRFSFDELERGHSKW